MLHFVDMRVIILLTILFCLCPLSPYAEEKPSAILFPSEDNALKHTKSGRIDKVIDSLTLLLQDGDIVRLSSISIPDFNSTQHTQFSEAALEYLKSALPENTEIMMYQTRMAKKGRKNRMSHELAQIVIKKDKQWIQGEMLAKGFVYADFSLLSEELANELQTIESTVIKGKTGIWSEDSAYKLQNTENVKIGQFGIIEGQIKKVATVRNNVYLNFGDNWKTDFTVMITPALRKKLARDGISTLELAGQTIRVRGWVREYNGPLIELDTPAHLQLIQQEPSPTATEPLPSNP